MRDDVRVGDIITVSSGAGMFADGMEISIWSIGLPKWVRSRWFQDGDRAIVLWLYSFFGWKLPTVSHRATITSVDTTTNTLWIS